MGRLARLALAPLGAVIVPLAVGAILATPQPRADAHALLRYADPENGATLQQSPEALTLTFTEEPEPAFSSIRVLNAAGQPVSQGPPRPVAGSPASLRLPLRSLPAGVYTVTWRAVSRIDGHVTGGVLAFGVGVTPVSIPASDAVTSPSAFDAVVRWLFYAGLAAVMGCAWVWTQVLPSAAAGSWHAPWLAWIAAALGVAGLEEAQRAAAGVNVVQFLNTWLGWTMAWRAVFVLSAAVALLFGATMTGRQRRAALVAAGCCASLAVFAHVGAGHAAAAPAWRWARTAIQWLHVSAIGAWLGGLGALLLAVGGSPSDDRTASLRRFSVIAGILLALVIATGATRAIQEVGAWDRLYTTPYGRLILLKIGLLVILVILGALNRYRSIPQAAQTLQVFRRVGTWEVAVAGVALVVTAILTQTAPASLGGGTVTAGGTSPVVVTGNDFATSTRARLEISPGLPGMNRFALALRDYDTGSPVVADRVSLRFRSVGRPDLAPSTLGMVHQGRDDVYRAQGVNLSLEGKWVVVAIVERGVNSVEVPLVVTMRSQPQNVRTIQTPGQPALYSVEFPGGIVLDAYLDPGRPGFNEIHVTFIGAGGQELPVPGLAAIVATGGSEGPFSVPVRRFGPGHFIGDAALSAGAWDIEVIASTADGRMLRARFQVRV